MKNRNLTIAGLGVTAAAALTTAVVPASAGAAAAKAKKYAGKKEMTMWGPVTVTIIVKGRKMTGMSISAEPHTPRSYQLQSYSLPLLRKEALKAHSYRVHIVSGATITSDGFAASLYTAMKHAHIV